MSCPDPQQLQQLLDETLPMEQTPTIQAHLETCADCQKKLEQLAAGGVTWDKTANNLAEQPKTDETALHNALEKLQTDPTSALQTKTQGPSAPIDDDLSFLQPSQKPNSLGRLDEFEILSVVGKGGFGIVLKAFDETLHRIVAIKVLAPQMAASGIARQRFIREARAAAPITHENVVTIHKVSPEGSKFPYLAMQFVSGQTLNEKIDKAGSLSVKEVLRIGMQMAEGLAAAHKQGLVHRDIKPANILLENGVERVKITDFGLARIGDDASLSQSGTIAGTPMYMSPEQANGEAVDHRSDLFSLGSVLYMMCTGRAPFRANSTMAVMKRVCDETPKAIREVNAEIPDWLEAIITKLHAKKPADRFQTATEVAEVLGQHLAELQAGRAEGRKAPVEGPATITLTTPAASTPVALRSTAMAPVYWMSHRGFGGFLTSLLVPLLYGLIWLLGRYLKVDLSAPFFATAGICGLIALGLAAWTRLRQPYYACGAAYGFFFTAVFMVIIGYKTRSADVAVDATVVLGGPFDPIGLEKVIIRSVEIADEKVRHDGRHVAVLKQEPGFVKPKKESQVMLPPGKYEVEAVCRPGYLVGKFEFTRDQLGLNLFSQGVRLILIDLEPGDRILLQLVIEKATDKRPPPELGWVQLFNGKDLTGWNPFGAWKVEDGQLVGRNKEMSYLFTKANVYEDFHLLAEMKLTGKGECKLWFRTQGIPFLPPPGYGVDLSARDGLAIGSLWRHGTATDDSAKIRDAAKINMKLGEWFTVEVIARGPRLEVRVNGQMVSEYTDAKNEHRKGAIALSQAHHARFFPNDDLVVRFRKIEIKELAPEAPAWVPLFKDKDLDNWEGDTKLVRWNSDTLFLSSTNAKLPVPSKLANRKGLKDFELEFDIKTGKETGLIHLPVWVQVRGEKKVLAGPSELLVGYQLDVRPKHFGELHHGSVAGFKRVQVSPVAHSLAKVLKKDEFNRVRIRCVGKHLTVQLNGFTMLDEELADLPAAGFLSIHWSAWTEVLLQNVCMRELSSPPTGK